MTLSTMTIQRADFASTVERMRRFRQGRDERSGTEERASYALDPRSGELVEIDPDQRWFWTPEWQAKEREADRAIAEGRVHSFDTMEEMIAFLDAK